MIQITLPDGSQREFPGPVTVAEVPASIGAGLAKAALAGKVDGKVVDTSFQIDGQTAPVHHHGQGRRWPGSHSPFHGPLAGLCGQGTVPDAQVTIGPVIEHGFFYDFSYKRPFTPEDLVAIEKKMSTLAALDEPVTRRVLPRDEAVYVFQEPG
jgi:threonyl-tRNA synthetase